MSALRPCPTPGCARLVRQGRCEQHARPGRPAWAGAGKGHTVRNQALRAQVMREEPTCRLCGAPSKIADHIIPLGQHGLDVRENLQGLCASCSGTKSAREGNAARVARARMRGRR